MEGQSHQKSIQRTGRLNPLKPLPKDWQDEEPNEILSRMGRLGGIASAKARMERRSRKVPRDYVLILESQYFSRKKPQVDWRSGLYTKTFLKLLRDEKESFSSIAKKMNETFNTNLFNRNVVASRLQFLLRLWQGREDVWKRGTKGRGPE